MIEFYNSESVERTIHIHEMASQNCKQRVKIFSNTTRQDATSYRTSLFIKSNEKNHDSIILPDEHAQ